MSNKNNIFQNIANNIIAVSPQNESPNQSGSSLYDHLTALIFDSYKDLSIVQKKQVVAFYKNKRDIFSIQIQTNAIKVVLNAKQGSLKDVNNITRDVSKIGHWGNGDYQIKLEDKKQFDNVIELIRQLL